MSRVFTIRKLRASVRQEKKIAKDIGGRRVAGSGSLPGMKGDVTSSRWLVEAKQTVTQRFSLTLRLWRKIEGEAVSKGKLPVMLIEMSGRTLAVIDYNDFLAIRDID